MLVGAAMGKTLDDSVEGKLALKRPGATGGGGSAPVIGPGWLSRQDRGLRTTHEEPR